MNILIRHAKQVIQVCKDSEHALCGDSMNSLVVLEQGTNSTGYSIVVDSNGVIVDVDRDEEFDHKYKGEKFTREIDATGKCVLPGFIDGHTHPVWEGDRVHEFAMKLSGATYMDIHKAGGGIHFTVAKVHEASEETLYQSFSERMEQMMKCGTTTVEVKSGYGLDEQNEIKMLRVIERGKRELDFIDISSTYCGAHAIPRGKTVEEATDDVINHQIPRVKQLMEKGELRVDNIDVFCEQGVFDVNSTKKILQAGQSIGLAINFHGDELHPMGSAELGASLEARAISHLEEVSDEGIQAMANKEVIAVLLPTTAYILRLKPPPARKMISRGVPVALGSDFNPNAFCYSMPMVMHLACCILRMSMAEALIASTINAAASLGLSKTHGSIEVGKFGDFVIINAPRWEHLIYQFGGHNELIQYVVKKGIVVYTKQT